MGAMARQGPHQVAQKSTSTGLSDFKTSWSKFASVTSTIPLPAIFFLLTVNFAKSATLCRCAAGRVWYECLPRGIQLFMVTLPLDAWADGKVARLSDGQGCDAFSPPALDTGAGVNDLMKLTNCHRWASGSLDQTGIPLRTTPLVSSQNNVPELACCTSSASRLGAFLPPSAISPWHSAQCNPKSLAPAATASGSGSSGLRRAAAFLGAFASSA